MKYNHLIPELYVINFQESLNFYKNILGFTLEYQRTPPFFAFLSYHGSQLMIQEDDNDEEWHNGKPEYPYGRGLNFQIETDNVQQIIDSLRNNNYPLKRGVKDSWYKENQTLHGCREILVLDPSGYLLRFSQGLGQKPVNS
ncbi:VOC family protein [soil metagenome]